MRLLVTQATQISILKRTWLRGCAAATRCVCGFWSFTRDAATRRSSSAQCFSWNRSIPMRSVNW
jgi:hypothetical protein